MRPNRCVGAGAARKAIARWVLSPAGGGWAGELGVGSADLRASAGSLRAALPQASAL